jgi:hypothetical protein
MKIELKNFKHYERLSEETYCFIGNIWVNGVKCGSAENSGKGGCTSIHSEGTQQSKELLKQAEEYCLTLPPYYIGNNNFVINMNLEHYIDTLADKMISDVYKQKNAQKMRKKMQNAILIGNEDEYRTIAFKMPLKDVMEKHTEYFKKVLKEKLEKYAQDNYRLLNTNIPQQFLN